VTISANSDLEYQRDELITAAYQLAGMNLTASATAADDIAMASTFMNLELQMLQGEGVVLRTIERTTLTLVAGTASYSLPSSVIDVELGTNGQAGSIVPTSGGENIVMSMSRSDYLDISSKTPADTSGRPTRVYIEKTSPITVTFWPTPDSTSTSWRYAKVRLLADADDGAVTLDLARRWLLAITYAVAAQVALAKSASLDKVRYLRGEAERLKNVLRADDSERGPIHFVMSHSGRRW
jgi:hypothetical protein